MILEWQGRAQGHSDLSRHGLVGGDQDEFRVLAESMGVSPFPKTFQGWGRTKQNKGQSGGVIKPTHKRGEPYDWFFAQNGYRYAANRHFEGF
jgi:hypothetical protein